MIEPGVELHFFDPSTHEAQSGGTLSVRSAWYTQCVPDQPEPQSETLPWKTFFSLHETCQSKEASLGVLPGCVAALRAFTHLSLFRRSLVCMCNWCMVSKTSWASALEQGSILVSSAQPRGLMWLVVHSQDLVMFVESLSSQEYTTLGPPSISIIVRYKIPQYIYIKYWLSWKTVDH